MDIWIDRYIGRWMLDQRVVGLDNVQVSRDEQKYGMMDKQRGCWMDGYMDGKIQTDERSMARQLDMGVDGQTWTDGWMDERVGGWLGRFNIQVN